MDNILKAINRWVQAVPKEFAAMSEAERSIRPSPNKWSKKEIVGHLCDSAINNIQRFIKIQYTEQPYIIEPYNQEQWVSLQNYQERSIDEILNLFQTLNKQVITIIMNIPEEKLSYPCVTGNTQKTLLWLIQDYLNHMEHHINEQILNKRTSEITS